ncbi:MAG: hypothetical protein IPM27_04635 [Nitrosomonadales bacterium]|nr:hypothetical protein [Nitrosomonadales bacterium]
MTTPDRPGDPADNLPLLTNVVGEEALDDLPTLTEVVTETTRPEGLQPDDITDDIPPHDDSPDRVTPSEIVAYPEAQPDTSSPAEIPRILTEAELQQLLDRVGTHLTTAFTEKLSRHLEQLHHQAVAHAIGEFRDELPELLRDALDSRRDT